MNMNKTIHFVPGNRTDLIQAISYWLGPQEVLHLNLESLINRGNPNNYDLAVLYINTKGEKESFLSYNTSQGKFAFNHCFNEYSDYENIHFSGYAEFRKYVEESKTPRKYEIGDVICVGKNDKDKRYYMVCTNYYNKYFLVSLTTYVALSKFDTIELAIENTNYFNDLVYVGKIDKLLNK